MLPKEELNTLQFRVHLKSGAIKDMHAKGYRTKEEMWDSVVASFASQSPACIYDSKTCVRTQDITLIERII